jgi:hypothetical protein
MSEQKALYKYEWDFGRLGTLSRLFLARPSQVAAAIGKSFDFGEVFGKHSRVIGAIGPGDIELVSDDPADIAVIEHLIGKDDISGRNPLKYLQED